LRTITRIPLGHRDNFSSAVTSATQAPSRTRPSLSIAGVQACFGIRGKIWVKSSGRVNPTEYDNRCVTIQSRNSWVQPAESVRISTLRPGLVPARCEGSCLRASRTTVMWSAAVFDPAFPGRNMTASGSPDPSGPWSTNAHNGWNP
jgi:hypothetical protein